MSKADGLYPSIPTVDQQFHEVPPGYTPNPGQQGVATVMVSSPIPPLAFGPTPQNITCPNCQNQVTSEIRAENTTRTHLIALLLCMFCCIPCCLVPYCMDSCRMRNHYCPSCNTYLGSYQ